VYGSAEASPTIKRSATNCDSYINITQIMCSLRTACMNIDFLKYRLSHNSIMLNSSFSAVWRKHYYVLCTETADKFPTSLQRCRVKEAMSCLVPAVHASFFTPFRFGLPFHHFTNSLYFKVFVLPLQPFSYIPFINRHTPRHICKRFTSISFHFNPCLKNGIASFAPAACSPH